MEKRELANIEAKEYFIKNGFFKTKDPNGVECVRPKEELIQQLNFLDVKHDVFLQIEQVEENQFVFLPKQGAMPIRVRLDEGELKRNNEFGAEAYFQNIELTHKTNKTLKKKLSDNRFMLKIAATGAALSIVLAGGIALQNSAKDNTDTSTVSTSSSFSDALKERDAQRELEVYAAQERARAQAEQQKMVDEALGSETPKTR